MRLIVSLVLLLFILAFAWGLLWIVKERRKAKTFRMGRMR